MFVHYLGNIFTKCLPNSFFVQVFTVFDAIYVNINNIIFITRQNHYLFKLMYLKVEFKHVGLHTTVGIMIMY